MSSDREIQQGELDALTSIFYPEEFQIISTSQNEELKCIFFAFLKLPEGFVLKFKKTLESSEPSYAKIKYLPPIELHLTLPKNYPSKSPPDFLIRCQWLEKRQLSLLCKKMDQIWDENKNSEVIYTYLDFIKNDTLTFLNIKKELDISKFNETHLTYVKEQEKMLLRRGVRWNQGNNSKDKENKDLKNPEPSKVNEKNDLIKTITKSGSSVNAEPRHRSHRFREYNDNRRNNYNKRFPENRKKFVEYKNNYQKNNMGKKYYDSRAILSLYLKTPPVDLLLDYNMERDRIEFLRNCYTCNICFTDKLGKDCTKFNSCDHVFCKDCIRDYFTVKIKDGTVLSIKCPDTECTSEADPTQVKEIVSDELFAKYDSLLLNTALDTLNDIVYCPRTFCHYPVSLEPEEQLAICAQCQYVFCVYCKAVYHGVEPCKYKTEEKLKLIEKYQNASSDVKLQMELRYGKKQLETLVNNSMAESWIKNNSKACPHCGAAIEKSQGCNKMACWKCNTFFCWLCEAELDPMNPYFHYSDPNSRCASKLFHLVEPEEEEGAWEDWDWLEGSEDEEDFFDMEFDEAAVYFI